MFGEIGREGEVKEILTCRMIVTVVIFCSGLTMLEREKESVCRTEKVITVRPLFRLVTVHENNFSSDLAPSKNAEDVADSMK